MEKSHHHSQNADEFSINSVYLETFRKRKMKKKQKSKNASKLDGDYTAFTPNAGAGVNDVFDSPISEDGAKTNGKQGAMTPKMFYSMMYSQMVPMVTKTVLDILKVSNKTSGALPAAQETVAAPPATTKKSR